MHDVSKTSNSPSPVARQHERTSQQCNLWVCYMAFFAASFTCSSVHFLLSNSREYPTIVTAIILFFASQVVGSVCFGVLSDMKGRRKAINWTSGTHLLGLCLALLTLLFYTGGQVFNLIPMLHRNGTKTLVANEYIVNPNSNNFGSTSIPLTTQTPKQTFNTEALSLANWDFKLIPLLLGLSTAGIGTGGMQVAAVITLAESVLPTVRTFHLSLMFAMMGIASILNRALAASVYAYNPIVDAGTVFTVLIMATTIFNALSYIMNLSFAVETKHFLQCNKPQSILHEPYSFLTEDFMGTPRNTTENYFSRSCSWEKYKKLLPLYIKIFVWELLGTSIPWMLFDFCCYGDGVFHFLLVQNVKGRDTDPEENLLVLIVTITSFIGYIIAPFIITQMAIKLVRGILNFPFYIYISKQFQILGFVVLAFVNFGLALSLYSITHTSGTSVTPHSISSYMGASLLYDCMAQLFNFIPTLTLMIIPVEAFPTQIRGSFYSASVALSRIGALCGILISWKIYEPKLSRASVLSINSIIALFAAAITRALSPNVQPFGEDLEKLDADYRYRAYQSRNLRYQRKAFSNTRNPFNIQAASDTTGFCFSLKPNPLHGRTYSCESACDKMISHKNNNESEEL